LRSSASSCSNANRSCLLKNLLTQAYSNTLQRLDTHYFQLGLLVFYGTTGLRQDCARPAAHDFLSKIIRPGFKLTKFGIEYMIYLEK